jgi:hypothetical protein
MYDTLFVYLAHCCFTFTVEDYLDKSWIFSTNTEFEDLHHMFTFECLSS